MRVQVVNIHQCNHDFKWKAAPLMVSRILQQMIDVGQQGWRIPLLSQCFADVRKPGINQRKVFVIFHGVVRCPEQLFLLVSLLRLCYLQ